MASSTLDSRRARTALCALFAASAMVACGGGGGAAASTEQGSNQAGGAPVPAPSPAAPAPGNAPAPSPNAPAPSPTAPVPAPPAQAPAPATGTAGLPCDVQAITCVEVSSASAQASVPITFGQPFRPGHLPSTSGLRATDASSGAAVPLQIDEVSTHGDGSVRFAVLSAQLSNLAANQPRIINLYPDTLRSSAPSVPANPDWNLELEATVYNGNSVIATLSARPQTQLTQQIQQSSGQRLRGQVANEYTVVAPFVNTATGQAHPHLSARLHTRLYDSGSRIRTDVVLENNWTFKASPANITYSLQVKRNGAVIHSQPKLTHFHHARWHKVLWTGSSSAPQYRLRHHMPYFLSSRMLWNYNLALKVPESVLADEARAIASANTAPMGSALIQPYFPATGGRPDIGPLPRWSVLYLLTQDDRARNSMLVNADAAASVPIHYRDEGNDHPVNVQRHPNISLRYPAYSTPAVPAGSGSTIWEPDRAHQPSFAYLPYLVTGDAFYLDEIMFWASWNIAWSDTDSRQGAKGLITGEQTRGMAWALRSLAEAAHALPDNHAQKAYYKSTLVNNLDWYDASTKNPNMQSPLGAMWMWDGNDATIPWQNDFVATIFSRLAENNEPKAKAVLDVFSKFNVGRFLNEANGFCAKRAFTYDMYTVDTSGRYFTTWGPLYNRKYPELVGRPCSQVDFAEEAYPGDPNGMLAFGRGALASAANAGVTGALEAYNKVRGFSPDMDTEFLYEPTWAIVPR